MKVQRYGWRRQLPDQRDQRFMLYATAPPGVDLPASVDLRPNDPPIKDQGEEGSCTAFAATGADWFVRRKLGLPDFEPSEAFTYWGARVYEGTVPADSGAQVREALRDLVWHGACPIDVMPYVAGSYTLAPSPKAKAAAAAYKVTAYHAIPQTLTAMRACLAEGYPFISGFTVYDSFESSAVARTGVVTMPHWSEDVLGGHAVVTVGYDNGAQRFLVRNSWGTEWGQHGYFTVPYAYWTSPDLAADFWTLRRST